MASSCPPPVTRARRPARWLARQRIVAMAVALLDSGSAFGVGPTRSKHRFQPVWVSRHHPRKHSPGVVRPCGVKATATSASGGPRFSRALDGVQVVSGLLHDRRFLGAVERGTSELGPCLSPAAPDRSWDDRPHAAVAMGSTPSISSGCPAAATRQGSPTPARSGTPRRSRSPPSAMPRTGWPPSGLAWCAAPGVHPNSARSPWPTTPPACSRSGHLHVQRQHRGVTLDRRTRLGFALSGCRRSRPRRARW